MQSSTRYFQNGNTCKIRIGYLHRPGTTDIQIWYNVWQGACFCSANDTNIGIVLTDIEGIHYELWQQHPSLSRWCEVAGESSYWIHKTFISQLSERKICNFVSRISQIAEKIFEGMIMIWLPVENHSPIWMYFCCPSQLLGIMGWQHGAAWGLLCKLDTEFNSLWRVLQ